MKVMIAGFGSIGRRHFRNLLSLGVRDLESCLRCQPDGYVPLLPGSYQAHASTWEERLNH